MAVPTGTSEGIVVSTMSAGAYLRLDGRLVAVLERSAPAGPLHLVVDGSVPRPDPGSEVRLRDGLLHTEEGIVDCRGASPHRPEVLDGQGWARARRRLSDLAWGDQRPDGIDLRPLVELLSRSDLAGAAALLGGRGSGLTPAGDDVLAGVLLAAHAAGWAPTTLAAIARGVPTGALSLAFLEWAARGVSIEPVHRLLGAAAGREEPDDLVEAARDAAAVGASSGAALVAGLVLAARHLPVPAGQPAAAVP